jgi:hypothetical protein
MTSADEGTESVDWFKVESGIRSHRKTRLIPRERIDVPLRTAAMGVWLMAAAWTAKEETDGFVPAEELEPFDPDGVVVKALITAGYVTEATVKGEIGYQLHDWEDRQMTSADLATQRQRWATKKAEQRRKAAGQQLSLGDDDPGPGGGPDGPTGGLPDGVPADVPGGHPEVLPDGVRKTKSKNKYLNTSSSGDDAASGGESPGDTRSSVRPRKTYGDEFERFWAAYPSRGGDAKHPASLKFEAAVKSGVPAPLLVEAAKRYAAERHGKDPQYTAMAKTWLSQRRWENVRQGPLRAVAAVDPTTGAFVDW